MWVDGIGERPVTDLEGFPVVFIGGDNPIGQDPGQGGTNLYQPNDVLLDSETGAQYQITTEWHLVLIGGSAPPSHGDGGGGGGAELRPEDLAPGVPPIDLSVRTGNPVLIILDNLRAPVGRPDQMILPVNPQEIQVQTGGRMVSYSAAELGDFVTVRGIVPFKVQFDSFFPGPGRVRVAVTNPENPAEVRIPNQAPWVPADPSRYIPAHALAYRIEGWARNGIPLQFTMTHVGTHKFLMATVLIEHPFQFTIKGGHGDIWYRLSLVEHRSLKVWTMAEVTGVEGYGGVIAYDPNEPGVTGATYTFGGNTTAWPVMRSRQGAATLDGTPTRETPAPPTNYTIQDGDSLESIALKYYGRADLWPMIYESNKDNLRKMQEDYGIEVPDNPYTDTIFPNYGLVMPSITSAEWAINQEVATEYDPPSDLAEPPFSPDPMDFFQGEAA